MMNNFAVLVSHDSSAKARELRVRKALGEAGRDAVIVHRFSTITYGFVGDAGLTAVASDEELFCLAHGAAHGCAGLDEATVSVDETEGLVKLLKSRYETKCSLVRGLSGSFVALLGDRSGKINVVSDPSGNRQPFISVDHRELMASNHPLVCARLQASMQLDRRYEDFLLIYGFLPDGRTPFRGVYQLSGGCVFEPTEAGWNCVPGSIDAMPALDDSAPRSDAELYDRLYGRLVGAMEDQLAAGSEAGVLLGGFDSALVASLLHRLGKKVTTYSFRYKNTDFNQPHTDTLSKFLGCEHRWVDISPDVIESGLADYAESCIQPTNWLNYVIQTIYVCRVMRNDGVDVAYSGDGCDSVFLGYPGTYKRTRAFSRLPELPNGLVRMLTSLLGRPVLDRIIGHPYRLALNMLRATARPMPTRAFLTFRAMDEVTVRALRSGDCPPQDEDVEAIVTRLAEANGEASIQRLGYQAKALVSPNRAKLIACADVVGVRVLSPYMHPDLRAFAARVPDHLLRERGQSDKTDYGKICLMRMAERHELLPTSVIRQAKLAAIDSPIDSWFSRELRDALGESFSGLPFDANKRTINSLVNTTPAERFYKRHIGSTQVISDAVSLLATYGAFTGTLTRGKF